MITLCWPNFKSQCNYVVLEGRRPRVMTLAWNDLSEGAIFDWKPFACPVNDSWKAHHVLKACSSLKWSRTDVWRLGADNRIKGHWPLRADVTMTQSMNKWLSILDTLYRPGSDNNRNTNSQIRRLRVTRFFFYKSYLIWMKKKYIIKKYNKI